MLQLILKMQTITKHWCLDTLTTDMLHYLFETWEVTLGTTQPQLLTAEQRCQLAETNWWQGLWENAESYDWDMNFVTGLEQADTELIPFVLTCLDLDELHAFNWCRLYLGVTMLCKLFAEGMTIHHYYLQQPWRHDAWQQGT